MLHLNIDARLKRISVVLISLVAELFFFLFHKKNNSSLDFVLLDIAMTYLNDVDVEAY